MVCALKCGNGTRNWASNWAERDKNSSSRSATEEDDADWGWGPSPCCSIFGSMKFNSSIIFSTFASGTSIRALAFASSTSLAESIIRFWSWSNWDCWNLEWGILLGLCQQKNAKECAFFEGFMQICEYSWNSFNKNQILSRVFKWSKNYLKLGKLATNLWPNSPSIILDHSIPPFQFYFKTIFSIIPSLSQWLFCPSINSLTNCWPSWAELTPPIWPIKIWHLSTNCLNAVNFSRNIFKNKQIRDYPVHIYPVAALF